MPEPETDVEENTDTNNTDVTDSKDSSAETVKDDQTSENTGSETEENTAPETRSVSGQSRTVTLASLSGIGSIYEGRYIAKDAGRWYNASNETVAYYLDPRNFINPDRIYMIEDISYNGEYQTAREVSKIIGGTAIARNGYQPEWFVSAGRKYGVSPVHLAARVRQETGGGSITLSGGLRNGRYYYNPFNIGAYSSSRPDLNAIAYAQKQGWDTKQKAINGGASFIANGYINKGQNSTYLQRFNVANGLSRVGTHQYMTNVRAAYDEALTTKSTYARYGITNEKIAFVIPVYSNMPSSTSLPH